MFYMNYAAICPAEVTGRNEGGRFTAQYLEDNKLRISL